MARPSVASTPRPKVEDYEASDALRTLERADEIRANPSLHRAAQKKARKQMRALRGIATAKPMAMQHRMSKR